MTCEQAQHILLERPQDAWSDLDPHLQDCADCRDLSWRIRASEQRLERAVETWVQKPDLDKKWVVATTHRPPHRLAWVQAAALVLVVFASLGLAASSGGAGEVMFAQLSSVLRLFQAEPVPRVQLHRGRTAIVDLPGFRLIETDLDENSAAKAHPIAMDPDPMDIPEDVDPERYLAFRRTFKAAYGDRILVTGQFGGDMTLELLNESGERRQVLVQVVDDDVAPARPTVPWIDVTPERKLRIEVGERAELPFRKGVSWLVWSTDPTTAAEGNSTAGPPTLSITGKWPGKADVLVVYSDGALEQIAVEVTPFTP